jgi:Mlc titration factor MtfA (ptsG expression regulator)
VLGRLGRWLIKRAVPRVVVVDPAKRAAVRTTPLPPVWRAIIERELPHYQRLNTAQRDKLLADAHVFIVEKSMVGIEGFVIDDRVRALVGASAALLVLGRDIALFDHVTRVMIRPDVILEDNGRTGGLYHAKQRAFEDGEVLETWGEVEIAWTQLASAFLQLEGQNTSLHELAHAVDHADGKLDALMAHEHYDRWRSKLRDLALSKRREGWTEITEVIGDVEGPELFAAATELYFECPRRLHRIDAALFEAMYEVYGVDPRTFLET